MHLFVLSLLEDLQVIVSGILFKEVNTESLHVKIFSSFPYTLDIGQNKIIFYKL